MSCSPSSRGWVAVNWEKTQFFMNTLYVTPPAAIWSASADHSELVQIGRTQSAFSLHLLVSVPFMWMWNPCLPGVRPYTLPKHKDLRKGGYCDRDLNAKYYLQTIYIRNLGLYCERPRNQFCLCVNVRFRSLSPYPPFLRSLPKQKIFRIICMCSPHTTLLLQFILDYRT